MFERPSKTLKQSLFNVLENAQEYVADVCFIYPENQVLWAHKARVPEIFRNKYMSQLNKTTTEEHSTTLDISVVIPYTTLRQLLRFWYIAEFSIPTIVDDTSSLLSGLSVSTTSSSSASVSNAPSGGAVTTTTTTVNETEIRQEIQQLEQKLGMPLLPTPTTTAAIDDHEQWVIDLKRMMDEKIATDVVVNIFNVPSSNSATSTAAGKKSLEENSSNSATAPQVSFPAHRFILASQSPYFYAVFCTEFREASTSSVHMPSDLFSSTTLQVILHYFYTDSLILPPFQHQRKEQSHVTRLNEKKHELRILQKVFTAADFLGHYNTICKAVLLKMAIICHQFKCVCSDCAILLPSMLLFADKNEKYVNKLRNKLIALYADPLDSLAPLWSQKPFAILVNSMNNTTSNVSKKSAAMVVTPATATTTSKENGAEVISQIFNGGKVSVSSSPISPTPSQQVTASNSNPSLIGAATTELNLIQEITEKTFANITRHNSVRALHSLHLCLSYLRGADPFPTWSQPTLNILNQFLHSTVDMISSNFDYYCVEYPILLSCVDGIGFGFSVDFLGFVLNRVLTEGIHDGNAAILYQGIVRDLGGRQEIVKNVAVDSVLLDARVKCAQYISKRWMAVKTEGGFLNIEKDILRLLAEDINVPLRTLTKPLENDNFSSSLFSSFKKQPTGGVVTTAPATTGMNIPPPVKKDDATISNNSSAISVSAQQQKRFSVGGHDDLVKKSNSDTQHRLGRTRSLSASTTTTTATESILKKDTTPITTTTSHFSDTEDILPKAGSTTSNTRRNSSNTRPAYRTYKRNGSTGSLTDALLPIEIKDNNKEANSNDKKTKEGEEETTTRPTRLRFALPDTPSRVHHKAPGQRLSAIQNSTSSNINNNGMNMAQRSSARKSEKKNNKKRSKSPGVSKRWSLGGYSTASDSSDDEQTSKKKQSVPMVGQKIELLRRPLPTLGTIKYIGDVEFAKGVWVGVELESRLGNNDGSVDGKRYFQTFPQRGVFVKIDDFKIISTPSAASSEKK